MAAPDFSKYLAMDVDGNDGILARYLYVCTKIADITDQITFLKMDYERTRVMSFQQEFVRTQVVAQAQRYSDFHALNQAIEVEKASGELRVLQIEHDVLVRLMDMRVGLSVLEER